MLLLGGWQCRETQKKKKDWELYFVLSIPVGRGEACHGFECHGADVSVWPTAMGLRACSPLIRGAGAGPSVAPREVFVACLSPARAARCLVTALGSPLIPPGPTGVIQSLVFGLLLAPINAVPSAEAFP